MNYAVIFSGKLEVGFNLVFTPHPPLRAPSPTRGEGVFLLVRKALA